MAISQFILKGGCGREVPRIPRIFFQPYSPDLLGKFLRDFIELLVRCDISPLISCITPFAHWIVSSSVYFDFDSFLVFFDFADNPPANAEAIPD